MKKINDYRTIKGHTVLVREMTSVYAEWVINEVMIIDATDKCFKVNYAGKDVWMQESMFFTIVGDLGMKNDKSQPNDKT